MCPAFPQYRQSRAHLSLVAESGGCEKWNGSGPLGGNVWPDRTGTGGPGRIPRTLGLLQASLPESFIHEKTRVTRLLNEEGRSRTRRSLISSDSPLRYVLRSALSSHPLSAARVWNSRVYSAMLRDPCKMLCSPSAASALFEGWSNVFFNSSENCWRLEDSCGLFPTAAMAQSRARSERDEMMRATLAPSDWNREG